jgi:hypothetical protein
VSCGNIGGCGLGEEVVVNWKVLCNAINPSLNFIAAILKNGNTVCVCPTRGELLAWVRLATIKRS